MELPGDDYLLLDVGELFKITFQEEHLLLLTLGVVALERGVELVAGGFEGDFELDHLFAFILQITHQGLLHNVEIRQLLGLKVEIGA